MSERSLIKIIRLHLLVLLSFATSLSVAQEHRYPQIRVMELCEEAIDRGLQTFEPSRAQMALDEMSSTDRNLPVLDNLSIYGHVEFGENNQMTMREPNHDTFIGVRDGQPGLWIYNSRHVHFIPMPEAQPFKLPAACEEREALVSALIEQGISVGRYTQEQLEDPQFREHLRQYYLQNNFYYCTPYEQVREEFGDNVRVISSDFDGEQAAIVIGQDGQLRRLNPAFIEFISPQMTPLRDNPGKNGYRGPTEEFYQQMQDRLSRKINLLHNYSHSRNVESDFSSQAEPWYDIVSESLYTCREIFSRSDFEGIDPLISQLRRVIGLHELLPTRREPEGDLPEYNFVPPSFDPATTPRLEI